VSKHHQEPPQPDSNEQSGSGGRRTETRDNERSKDTGQDRYGQSGFGGKKGHETIGQARYRRSGPEGGEQADPESNQGSGRPDVDSRGGRDAAKPPSKKR